MARFRKRSRFGMFLFLVFIAIIGIGTFIMGGENPEKAKEVKEYTQEKAGELLEKGKELVTPQEKE